MMDPRPNALGVSLLEGADLARVDVSRGLTSESRTSYGQFMTPAPTARLMAEMFDRWPEELSLLDPGAGVGSLTAAFVERVCSGSKPPRRIDVVAFEVDPFLARRLEQTLLQCQASAATRGTTLRYEVKNEDFIAAVVPELRTDLFGAPHRSFDFVITNPPYKKIASDSETRALLRSAGADATNLYAGFVTLSQKLLRHGGELVAITPRSFCNGSYFRQFRHSLLEAMALKRLHVFEARDVAFEDDGVLQENVILHAVKGGRQGPVEIRSSSGDGATDLTRRVVPFETVVQPTDPERFLRVNVDGMADVVSDQMRSLVTALSDLGLSVSTGRVVDFRAREFLREQPEPGAVPLIYPGHFAKGVVRWPKTSKKPNALVDSKDTKGLLVPSEFYVLTKRFSSKEEKKRLVAALYDPALVPAHWVGFENHLNYFHANGHGLDPDVGRGLAVFLNSTIVDEYFRQLSGHTQVNVSDLKNLRYPSREQLLALSSIWVEETPTQHAIDERISEVLFPMTGNKVKKNPVRAKRKIDEAIAILDAVGMPKEQLNDRTALVLLALLDLGPELEWSESEDPLCGVTPMMGFFRTQYGRDYAPNTRETVRRQSLHQLLEAGHILINPDDPGRPTNSGKTVYKVGEAFLSLARTFGSAEWNRSLERYLGDVGSLRARYSYERSMRRIPVKLPSGQRVELSAGGQNELIKPIIEEFCARFAPGGTVLYVGDTGDKFAVFEETTLRSLGVSINSHGKMPDVVVHHRAKNWLLLIEAVTSHGPVDPKRRDQLKRLFRGCSAGLVFVTAFSTRSALVKFLAQISWETEVWVADSPTHLIHFNGERFLGPYD